MLKKAATVVGAVFLIIGIAGFIPGITVDSGGVQKLLGLFEVNAVHNLVHILSGLAFLAAASKERYARLAFQVFGVIYALVTLLGFLGGDGTNVLGLIPVNTADNFLHLLLAATFLYLGFGTPERRSATPAV